LVLVVASVFCLGAVADGEPPAPAPAPSADEEPAAPAPPLAEALPEQFAKVTDRLYRSAQPLGDATFAAIAAEGIKVVVSVDGARPDLAAAEAHGIRYVHIPIRYDGITRDQALRMAKVVTTLDGPFLFHCHHGKHRGPAACAIAARVLEGASWDAERLTAFLREAGTSARYRGLFRDVAAFVPPTEEELATLPDEFPSYVPPDGMTASMVAVSHGWENLKAVRKAGWRTPPAHPDVEPSHEALILAESFREMGRLPEMQERPEDFRAWLLDSEKAAWDLSKALGTEVVDAAAAGAAYDRIAAGCTDCHAGYRNNR
jgi:protein tyrosine phosphatase (PTP) superfamily phosphohydrolase (DUF442 family)